MRFITDLHLNVFLQSFATSMHCVKTRWRCLISRKTSWTLTTAILMIWSKNSQPTWLRSIYIALQHIYSLIIINLSGKCTHSSQVHCIIQNLTPLIWSRWNTLNWMFRTQNVFIIFGRSWWWKSWINRHMLLPTHYAFAYNFAMSFSIIHTICRKHRSMKLSMLQKKTKFFGFKEELEELLS